MLQFEASKGVEFCDGLTRRDFLRAGALSAGAVGLSLVDLAQLQAAPNRSRDINCILLFLVGGPSHLDTWDLKPDAPSEVRGPFRPTRTNMPGVEICEHFPLMATMADRYAIVRSVHHHEAPIHETGHQLMQTGRLFRGGHEYPHYGAVLSRLRGPRREGAPASAVVPGPIGNTGVSISHGQGAGYLGAEHQPVVIRTDLGRLTGRGGLRDAVDGAHRAADACDDPGAATAQLFAPAVKKGFDLPAADKGSERYGLTLFGQSCRLAAGLVEAGLRLVTVNMFDSVFDAVTWDCHADGGSLATTLDDYRDILCPMFDRAYAALLDDLAQRGLLDTTLVVAMGEFGRTPHLNPRGGRDHWPGCWSVLFAGAGVKGGQVIGSSDATGGEPKDRPVSPAEVAATVYHALDLDPTTCLPGPDGRPLPLVDAAPVAELFRG
ncbi:MAG TPA: DUF1501 domain-containing protein [Gemmataceae bacterium]|nr:DUF1501 domain-containing protein [Gemmataceae bacterium]